MFTVTWQEWNPDRERWEFHHAECDSRVEAEALLAERRKALPWDEFDADDGAIEEG